MIVWVLKWIGCCKYLKMIFLREVCILKGSEKNLIWFFEGYINVLLNLLDIINVWLFYNDMIVLICFY